MIDTETGLPSLPEGRRWLVREEWSHNAFYRFKTGHLEVVLERLVSVTDVTPIGSFWKPRRVIRTERLEWQDVAGAVPVRVQGAHPVAVANAANRVLKDLAAWESREALKGTYPPNKLEVS